MSFRDDPYNAALRAILERRDRDAHRLLSDLIARDRADARAHFLLGRLAGENGQFSEELAMTGRAVELEPHNAEFVAQLGKCYARFQDQGRALAAAELAEAAAQVSDLTLDAIGGIYTRFGLHERAARCLKRAEAEGSRNPAIFFNLGTSLKFCGDFAGSRLALEQAILLAPTYHKAHAALTSLGGITAQNNHLPRLSNLIEATAEPTAVIHLCHAASKECEALGRFDDSYAFLDRGKTALRNKLGYRAEADTGLVDRIVSTFQTSQGYSACDSVSPIFVVGMPRSGTTLVDRIISHHSLVASLGETQHFSALLKQQFASPTRHVVDDRVLAGLADFKDYTALGQAYVTQGKALAGDTERFVDKFHLNILLAGFMARAVPRAKIVCLARNPLDTIVSNYRQLFEFATPIYNYSLDLAAAARFYVQFRKLADLWQSALPDNFYTVNYEALVQSPETESRRLLDFCDLPWEEQCLHIERNTKAVATASSVQVRQPINTDSVGRWKHYDGYLDEVRAILRQAGIAV